MKANVFSGASVLAGIILTLAGGGAGCGGEPAPSGGGAVNGAIGETMPPPAGSDLSEVSSALSGSGAGGAGGAGGGSTQPPRVIYLFYADGNPLPKTSINACNGTPPKFVCNFGTSLLDCQKQVQSYLDRWYADFNIVFTLTRPTSGAFYTEVVSSGGGDWCDVDPKVAGVAPFLCKDIDGGVAYTFMGGVQAKQTAVIVAQEQAHLVGLEHTNSANDLMLPTICTTCDGFEDKVNTVNADRCGRPTQNSYQMMVDALGLWSGGTKPSAFGCQPDSSPPEILITSPADNSTVSHDFTVKVTTRDDCKMTKVEIDVAPQVLKAVSSSAPYEWDLTNITGTQTITITATDSNGKKSTSAITVTASDADAPAPAPHGCAVGGGSPAPGPFEIAVGLALTVATITTRRRKN